MTGKLNLDPALVAQARELARLAGQPVTDLARTHTTVSVERAVLRLAGLDGAEMGAKNIAAHLNDKGVTLRGQRWTRGRVHEVRVQRSLGLGLDEKAIEAVKTWKFEPAKKDGQAVAVMIAVEVNFHLY